MSNSEPKKPNFLIIAVSVVLGAILGFFGTLDDL
jgi:hypothetical protein